MDEQLAVLEKEYNRLAEKIEAVEKKPGPKKDLWDIVAATTPLITGLLISGIGLYFAYTNNQAQLKLQETQTIEKFIPHLIGSEPEKKAAIIALSTITNTETAAKYAELFPSEGTASALKSLATSSNAKDSDKKVATRALANTFHQMADGYQATQNSPAAAQAYEQSINEQEKLVGKDSPELVDNLNQLTDTYKAEGKYPLAELALKRILKIQENTTGSRSQQFIASLNKLAQVYKLEGKPDTANHLSDYAGLLAKQMAASGTSTDDNNSQNQTASTASSVAQDTQKDQQVITDSTAVIPDKIAPKIDTNESLNKNSSIKPDLSNTPAPSQIPPKDANTLSTTADSFKKSTL